MSPPLYQRVHQAAFLDRRAYRVIEHPGFPDGAARAPTIFPAVSGDTPLLIRLMYWVAADEPMSTTPDRPPAARMEP